ncbi:hypothetical protein CXB51_018327 [Gossypium anomalum]|uniref:Uncharacterized protein n=1 Tax=Gossypium anomalum TaxID=47600 RepID=A0A8J6CX28_9ROSI|nr:hypothetical protein CXB51_018327 [Gossypium anomalum]
MTNRVEPSDDVSVMQLRYVETWRGCSWACQHEVWEVEAWAEATTRVEAGTKAVAAQGGKGTPGF